MRVWHYTYSHRMADILRSRVLLPPRMIADYSQDEFPLDFRGKRDCEADKKLLLFSANPVWEPASYRGWRKPNGNIVDLLALGDYAEYGVTVYRIGVDTSILKPWVRLKALAHMSRQMAKSLEEVAFGIGSNPYDWWGTLFPVHAGNWRTVERFDGEWKFLEAEYTDRTANADLVERFVHAK